MGFSFASETSTMMQIIRLLSCSVLLYTTFGTCSANYDFQIDLYTRQMNAMRQLRTLGFRNGNAHTKATLIYNKLLNDTVNTVLNTCDDEAATARLERLVAQAQAQPGQTGDSIWLA